MNDQGFKKIQTERWEFANEYFLKGRKDVMKNIKRRNYNTNSLKSKIKLKEKDEEKKKHHKRQDCSRHEEAYIHNVLERHREFNMIEICNLKQKLRSLEERLGQIERKHQNMNLLITRAIQNPAFCYDICRRFKF